MTRKLFLDVETFSGEDLKKAGVHAYVASPLFDIILLAYAFDDDPVRHVNLFHDDLPTEVRDALTSPDVEKWAHNAAFERNAFTEYLGVYLPENQWFCTMVFAAAAGLPLSLDKCAKALGVAGKLATGKSLINFFCRPRESADIAQSTRNTPDDYPEKWGEFVRYCVQDVQVSRDTHHILSQLGDIVNWGMYQVDQRINDRGVKVDLQMARNATVIAENEKAKLIERMRKISGMWNPGSVKQLGEWIHRRTSGNIEALHKPDEIPTECASVEDGGLRVRSFLKDYIPALRGCLQNFPDIVSVLDMRGQTSRSSVSKYQAVVNSVTTGDRCRGLFQFLGASRTGRFAGRRLQLQNLKRISIQGVTGAREFVRANAPDALECMYGDVLATLSELIRTVVIAPTGYTLCVADYSAIEARVAAWLAGEEWRLEVFRTHGKIYEASAALICGKHIEDVTPEERQSIGKVSELAFGFGGGVGAALRFGADKYFTHNQIQKLVSDWRARSPKIVQFWSDMEECAKEAIRTGLCIRTKSGMQIGVQACRKPDGEYVRFMYIELRSGRRLHYFNPRLAPGIVYQGESSTGVWGAVDTYGGKLVENVVQATAADLLMHTLKELDRTEHHIVLHVHDEVAVEAPVNQAHSVYQGMVDTMKKAPEWATGLPLNADGYISDYYKK